MPLGTLSLSVTSGVQGRPFRAKINGLTTGKVDVHSGGSPLAGFSVSNGILNSEALPSFSPITVNLREYEPGATPSFKDTRIEITATSASELAIAAAATIPGGRTMRGFRAVGTAQADTTIVYSGIAEDDLGASRPFDTGGGTPTPTPTPTVSISSAISQNEGNSGTTNYVYTVTRSANTGAVNVPWTFSAGSTSASDFVGGSYPAGGNVSMADGVLTGTITIPVQGDTTVESDELFTVTLVAPSGYALGSPSSATGTIVNDDVAPTIYARQVAVSNTGGAAKTNFPVRIDLTSSNFDFTKAKTDGADLRAYDAGNALLAHWIEAWDAVAQTATLWVKVPTIGAGGSTSIKLTYGDPTATQASSISNTFIFGDDFSDPTALMRLPNDTPAAGVNISGVVMGNRSQVVAASGVADAWNQTVREQANVIYDLADPDPAKRYKLYYTGQATTTGGSANGARRVGLVYSPDGRTWTDYPGNPVIGNGTADRAEDPYIVRNIDGTLYRDPGGKMHMFSEDQAQLDMLHYTSTDGIAWTADPANPVIQRGAAGAYDDQIVASPIVIHLGGDNKFIMMYEARTSAIASGQPLYESTAIARSTSLNGKSWTKSAANPIHDGDVPDDLIFTGTQWIYLYHATAGAIRRAATTVTNPDNWDAASFVDLGPNPLFGTTGFSYNAVPETNQKFGRRVSIQPGNTTRFDIFDVMGSDAWEFTVPGSGIVSPYSSKIDVTGGAVVLDPDYATNADVSIVMRSRALAITNNFQVMCRRKAEARGTDDQLSQIGIGTGSVTAATGAEFLAYMADAYLFAALKPGTANELQYRKYVAGTPTVTSTATMGAAESQVYSTHRISYLSTGKLTYAVDGSVKYDVTDTTHLAKVKQVLISQGTRTVSSTRKGAKQSIDWVAVRPFDGVDPTAVVGVETAGP